MRSGCTLYLFVVPHFLIKQVFHLLGKSSSASIQTDRSGLFEKIDAKPTT